MKESTITGSSAREAYNIDSDQQRRFNIFSVKLNMNRK